MRCSAPRCQHCGAVDFDIHYAFAEEPTPHYAAWCDDCGGILGFIS